MPFRGGRAAARSLVAAMRARELGWLLVGDPLRWRRALQAMCVVVFLLGVAVGGALVWTFG